MNDDTADAKASTNDPLSQPGRLLSLLSLTPLESSWQPAELGQILAHQLDTPVREALADDSDATAQTTIRALLLDPPPSPDLLGRLKRFAKAATVSAENGLPTDVATVLYVATIVVGQRSGHAFTKLDATELRERVEWCARRSWLDPTLREIFVDYLESST